MTTVTARRLGHRGNGFLVSFRALLLMAGFALGAPAAYATTTLAVGTAPGQFSVSPTGAATYQISIPVPPGVNGLKPSLALLYNSQAGNGLLGQGWSLSGLSVISHCPETLDQDGVAMLPQDSDQVSNPDRLCLDGQRLVLISGTYGQLNSTYRTEIDSFRVVKINQGTSSSGPASFTVVDRAGLTSTYSTLVAGGNGGTGAVPLLWLITSVQDRYGNFINFTYNLTASNSILNIGSWDSIAQIVYGSATGSRVGKIIFSYNTSRPDTVNQYFAHSLVTVNPATLTGITIQDGNNNPLKTYTLSYQYPSSTPGLLANPPTELTSVQECAGTACYPATAFNYGGSAAGFGDGPPQINNTAMPGYMAADFDGDGLPDFIYEDNGIAYVVFGNNIATPVQVSATMGDVHQGGISLTGAVVVDLNGDGKQELMVPNFPSPGQTPNVPTWYVLAWNGQMGPSSALSAQPAPTTNNGSLLVCNSGESSCAMIATAMDIHRNGQSSLFYEDSGEFYYYANVNGAFNPTPVPTNLTYMTDVNGVSPQLTPLNWQGQAGVYVAGQNIGYSGVVSWNATSGTFTSSMSGDKALSGKTIPLDANGDGLPDAVSIEGTTWCYIANKGAGFDTSNSSNYSSCATAPGDTDLTKAQVIDWFGNGQQEVIVPLNSRWYLFEPLQSTFVNTNFLILGTPTEFIDVNDDGYLDMVYTTSDNNVHYLPNLATPYVINQITDGLGHNTDVGYVSLGAEAHGAYVQGVAPASVAPPQTRVYTGAMNIVKDFAVDTGTFDNSTPPKQQQIYTYYLYAGAAIEQWGRGFLGFSKIEAINYNTGLYTVDTYSQAFPYAGQVLTSSKTWNSQATLYTASVGSGGVGVRCTMGNPAEPACTVPNGPGSSAVTFVTGGVQISTTTNCYADAYDPFGHTANDPNSPCTVNNVGSRVYAGVYSPYTVSSTTQLYDIGPGNPQYETTTTKSTYKIVSQSAGISASGVAGSLYIGADVMPTDVTVTTSDPNDSTDNETVDTTSDYSTWEPTCPAHPGLVKVTHTLNGSSAPSQTETFTYNGNCFLTTDVKNIVGPVGSTLSMTQTKTYTPDVTYGNPLTSAVSGTNAPVRTTTMVYDATERFPTTITNSLNQTESLTYDAWGNKLTDTDANGNSVTYGYDGFERKTSQSGPLPDVGATWAYTNCGTNCAVGTVFQVTQTGSDGSIATTQYDEIARGIRSSHLGFSGETINQDTAYDLLGRAIQTSVPYKTGAIICSDFKGYDVLNRVTQETQPYGASATSCGNTRTVGYVYTGLKTVKTTSAAGTSITSEITTTNLNVLGKPSSVIDEGGPGNVTTSYVYDPWGNLTSVTPPDNMTGKVSVVSMTYDSIGDKLTMQDPDMGAWSYTYDALGELLTQTDAKGHTVTNTYDLLGRLVSRNEVEGETDWVYDIAYGAGVGKLAYTKGPGGVWEGYAYDAFGETTDKITVVGGQEYWVTNTYDDQGRVHQVVYPNMTAVNVSGMPAAPSGLTVGQVLNPDNSTSFNLAWTLNSATQNGQIFHIYRTPSNVTATITTTVPAQYEIYSGPVPNWQDGTVTKDDTYTWWLQACNDTNCSSYISQSLVVVLPPTVPIPVAPAAVQPATSWALTWSAASLGVTGNPGPISYIVQRSYNGGAWTQVYSGAGTTSDSGVTYSSPAFAGNGDGSYSYRAQACANGACSNFSAPSTETIAIQPSVPQSVTVPAIVTPQTSPASITVNWTAPAVNGGAANLSYTVAVYKNSALQSTSTAQSGTGFTDSETLDGTYSYIVTVCDTVNTSLCAHASSTNVAVTLPPVNPGAPTYYSDAQAPTWSISWTQSSSTPGNPSGTVSYKLQQSWNGGAFSDVTGTVTAGSTYWQTTTAVLQSNYYQNGTYTYQLRACTTDTAVSTTAACTAWIPSSGSGYVTTIAPGVVRSLTVPAQSNWDGSFTVTYASPAVNTGGIVTGYNLQVYDTVCTDPPNPVCHNVVEATCTPSPATNTTCTFAANSLPAGNNGYGLQVRANDNAVHGPWTQGTAPTIVYTSPPPAPTINETDASDGSHYTITYSASTATTYQLYFSSATKTGSWSAWAQVYSGSATSYYTGSPIGQYYLRYYAVACNQHAQCSPNSSVYSFTNPKEVTGCMTCSQTNPPTPPPAPGSTASAVSVVPERVALAAQATPAAAVPLTRVSAPEPESPVLRALALDTAARPGSNRLKRLRLPHPSTTVAKHGQTLAARTHGRSHASRLLAAATLSPRQAYFLAHAGRTTAPKPGHLRRVRHVEKVVATARYAPPVDPILSLYPPLRLDPRVMAQYEARGGSVPVRVQNANAGTDCRDTDNDVECTTPDSPNALMVGYVYNSHGYLQKVEKLNAGGTAIAELWQATEETAQGEVDKQVLDAPVGSTTGAFFIQDLYDPASGVLDSTTATAYDTVGGSTVLNPTYTWDGYNNLKSRNVIETVPTGQTGSPALNESFTYDAVNRLAQVTDNGGNITTPTYDAVGAIQSNGLYTGYKYNNTSTSTNGCTTPYYNQIHAVSGLTINGVNRSFCYDANGNLISEGGDVTRTIAWTSYNKPSQVVSNGITENFTYGPSRERLQTTVISSTSTVTTTYIDGLFEQVQDNAGNITYKHYILAGSARVGVETIATTSGTVNSDLLSFYVHDQVGGVIATVTEGLGGTGQQFVVYSHEVWGKARASSGAGAYATQAPGTYLPGTMSGQHEGFAGHEDLEDIGIVDMEGRIYDPELGRFLSADPNVQFPDSSQGYNRYTYCNNNPLSLSDPTGYISVGQVAGLAAAIVMTYYGDTEGWSWYATSFASGAVGGYIGSGGSFQAGLISGVEAVAFSYAGDQTSWANNDLGLLEKSVTEGLIGGAFTAAGGGRFSDGFLGAFVSSEVGSTVSGIDAGSYSAAAIATRTVVSAVIGGTVSSLTGGDFSDGAVAAAMQRLYNEEASSPDKLRQQVDRDLKDIRTQALLDVIGSAEGAYYNSEEGGGTFDDYSKFPADVAHAGRYQFSPGTFSESAQKLGLTDFSPLSQDRAIVYQLIRAGAMKPLLNNDFDGAAAAINRPNHRLIASFPDENGGAYGKNSITPLSTLEKRYNLDVLLRSVGSW